MSKAKPPKDDIEIGAVASGISLQAGNTRR